jgi:phytoene synthase
MAAPGIPMLDATSQPCIRAAYRMYRGILDEVKANDYDVFTRRAVVPNRRRLAITAASLVTPPGRRVRSG